MITLIQPITALQSQDTVLYAYYNEHITLLDGMVLGVSPKWSEPLQSNITREQFFTLFPALGTNLTIKGTILFKSWLKADSLTYGRLVMSLYEVHESGDKTTIARVEGMIAVNTIVSENTIGVAGIQHHFTSGSTIQFGLVFYPSSYMLTSVYLQWNNPQTPTRIILPCINPIKGDIYTQYNKGTYSENLIFLEKNKSYTDFTLNINITDPFGINNIQNVNLTISIELGNKIIDNTRMTPSQYASTLYGATFSKNITLYEGNWTTEIIIVDSSGNKHQFTKPLYITPIYPINLIIMNGDGDPLYNATYTIENEVINIRMIGKTDKNGLLTEELPSSTLAGEYSITAIYSNIKATKRYIVNSSIYDELIVPIHQLQIKVTIFKFPLIGARGSLLNESLLLLRDTTDQSGMLQFNDLPFGNYTINVYHLFQNQKMTLNFDSPQIYIIEFNPLLFQIIPWIVIAIIAMTSLHYVIQKIKKPKVVGFPYLEKLMSGTLPDSLTVMISGPPGVGKTILLENFIKTILQDKRRCIYISNTAFPNELRKSLKKSKIPLNKYEKKNYLIFIDCYAAIAGKESSESHFVSSPEDLTRLGIEISASLESLKNRTDICFDSLSQLSTYVKSEQLLSFIKSVGARIKGRNGRFIFTIGSNIDKDILGLIEEVSDCVIELNITESDEQQIRTLRIKKLKGKKHLTQWVNFEISSEGIIFKIT